MDSAVRLLKDKGAIVEEIDLKLPQEIFDIDGIHWDVYTAVIFNHFASGIKPCQAKLDPLLVAAVERGKRINGVQLKYCEVVATNLWKSLFPIFRRYDAILCASALTPAPLLTSDLSEYGFDVTTGHYRARSLAGIFNLVSRCPALQVPVGFTTTGLPTGIQVVGNRYEDLVVLRIGKAIESALDVHKRKP
jgi:Asp-tRNA(Asn)/Glu-tRNA(Gln) amidotransferase A subunit family amidase